MTMTMTMTTVTTTRAKATTTIETLAATLLVAVIAAVLAWTLRDDDRPVDPARPDARRAIAAAREVVPGRLVDVRRDSDNGKWEVTLRADGRDYEVELAPRDLALLRIDYD
jgi:uncharacterized membrane protein YkoI